MLVKICGLRSAADVKLALACNADFYGLIFHEKSPRYINPEEAAALPCGKAGRVGVFTTKDAEEISRIAKIAALDFIQLHGEQNIDVAKGLGPERIIRVLWPMRYSDIGELKNEAQKWAPYCSMFLLDAGKSGGGSGKNLEWTRLSGLNLPQPWLLAGGLTPENVLEAVNQSLPAGVDLNSGMEDEFGRKSPQKIRAALSRLEKFRRIQ